MYAIIDDRLNILPYGTVVKIEGVIRIDNSLCLTRTQENDYNVTPIKHLKILTEADVMKMISCGFWRQDLL